MPEAQTTRRLAAVLAADVVGYSRMMGADETGTLAALKQHRETLFNPAVAEHNGRVVKLIGDGTLVEFASVVDAVNCALGIQRAIAATHADGSAPRITLRIGINLGDVIIDGDDIYGDGVNVAARLEPLAEPGGICVSAIVNESVGSRVEVSFNDGGEVAVKNIARPIRVWKWHPGKEAVARKPATGSAPTGAAGREPKDETTSIAVLPFDNMSGDPEQEYFSDGISEDIITDLSKVGGLVVIARNSSFAYKGRATDIRTVGRELSVRTVLEGSIRRAGNRVRINAQLIDAETGAHLWAERFDRDLTDIFAVQDEVTAHIVSALKVTLTPAEKSRLVAGGGTESTEAHDYLLQARRLLARPFTKQVVEAAIDLLHSAIAIDPDYAEAQAALAMAYCYDFQNQWTGNSHEALDRAVKHVEIAIAKDPNDAYAHYAAGVVIGYRGDRKRAVVEFETAHRLSPNDALIVNAKGVSTLFGGDAAEAIPLIERAIRLDPVGSQQYIHFLGLANLVVGNLETAAALFRERIILVPETDLSRSLYASTLGHLGRTDEAHQIWRDLYTVNPKYSFEHHMGRLLFEKPNEVALIAEGLAKAGINPALGANA